MPSAVLARDTAPRGRLCDWCEQHPNRPCPACNARRQRAGRLVEQQGLSVTAAAERMGLPVGRVERLLEEKADRREVAALRLNHISNAPLRQRFLQQRRGDPALTSGEIGDRLGTTAVQIERWLGLRATAPKTDRRGRRYPGRVLDTIDVEIAGRLARALGYAPCELDGSWP